MNHKEDGLTNRQRYDLIALDIVRTVHPKYWCADDIHKHVDPSSRNVGIEGQRYIARKVFTYYNVMYAFNYSSAIMCTLFTFKHYIQASSEPIASAKKVISKYSDGDTTYDELGVSIRDFHERDLQEVLLDPSLVTYTLRD